MPRSAPLPIVPAPALVVPSQGALELAPGAGVHAGADALLPLVERFEAEVRRRTGLALSPAGAEGATVRIELAADPAIESLPEPIGLIPSGAEPVDERYSLTVDATGVVLRAAERAGAARGLTTLVQLLAAIPNRGGALSLPAVQVLDGPRFAWRELSVDLVRATFTAAEVKRVIDLVALHKLNVLHLHLTDDQAWRLEAGRPDSARSPDGTFFSRAELQDLVAYAAERFVTLLPEVDTPGHARALLAVRPELDTGRNRVEMEIVPGFVHQSAWLDPGEPDTFGVIEAVLTEVASIFPGPYLHIGGDEAFGMPGDLYAAYVQRARAFVRSLGRRPVGWQETARAGVGPDDVIQYWMSVPDVPLDGLPDELRENLVVAQNDVEQAVIAGARVVVTPFSNCYLDVPYEEPSAEPDQEERRGRLGLPVYPAQTVESTYDWDPAAALGTDVGQASIGGVGAAIWCETVEDFDDLTFLLLPRLAGLAEKGWSPPTVWSDHRARLPAQAHLWDQDGLTAFRSSLIDW